MEKKLPEKALIGVAWPYANGQLHLGHIAGNFLPAELKNQYLRQRGVDVIMVSGSDMHGTPVAVKAWENKQEPHEYAMSQHKQHLNTLNVLGYNFSLYTSTETTVHRKVSQLIFKALAEVGYLVKKETELYWSEKEHKYLLDRYIEGTCPNCGAEGARGDQCDNCGKQLTPDQLINPYSIFGDKDLKKRKSTNYFLALDKLQPKIESLYQSHPYYKEWRRHVQATTEAWLKEGLEPRAITRDMEGYGVPLPPGFEIEGEEGKVMYVWFEGVIGYFSAPFELQLRTTDSGKENKSVELENFEELFAFPFSNDDLENPADTVQLLPIKGQVVDWKNYWLEGQDTLIYNYMAKDNITFHSIIWPAMLLGLNEYLESKGRSERLALPSYIPANQYLNLKGAKFSKSKGNIINPVEFEAEYGQTASRYFLITRMPEQKDYNFTMEEFMEANNNELLANLGNFVNRALVFWNKYYAAEQIDWSKYELTTEVAEAVQSAYIKVGEHLFSDQFSAALKEAMNLSNFANKYFNDSAIWSLRKTDVEKSNQYMSEFIYLVLNLANILRPLLPEFSQKLFSFLAQEVKEFEVGVDQWQPLSLSLGSLGEIKDLEPLIKKLELAEEN
jgi:methionyl-tRNA synthetase